MVTGAVPETRTAEPVAAGTTMPVDTPVDSTEDDTAGETAPEHLW